MEHSEKIHLKIKKHNEIDLFNALSILLKLAQIKGFNSEGNLRGHDGNYVANTNVIEHILNSFLTKDVPNGRSEFFRLLKDADVNNNHIRNANVRTESSNKLKPFVFQAPKIDPDDAQVREFREVIPETSELTQTPKIHSSKTKTYVKRYTPLRPPSTRQKTATKRFSPSQVQVSSQVLKKINKKGMDQWVFPNE